MISKYHIFGAETDFEQDPPTSEKSAWNMFLNIFCHIQDNLAEIRDMWNKLAQTFFGIPGTPRDNIKKIATKSSMC